MTVLASVRVYRDGAFGHPEDVVIDGAVVGRGPAAGPATASGGYLVPGLIDCHIHLHGPETLDALAAHGVTSGLDMSSPAPLVAALRGRPGVTDIRSPLMAATSPASAHAARMKDIPAAAEALVSGAAEADAWVARHVEQGADYIKVVIDLPGFDQPTVDALVAAAHDRGLTVVAHAARSDAVAMAQRAGVDVLTHAPLDRPIDEAQAAALVASGTVIVPTLTMMRGIVENLRADGVPGPAYEPARASVATLHAAGMPILAGTDANRTPAAPASPVFGESLHDELALLVDAGLTPAQALDAATSVAADHFGLPDRGRITAGRRADLVLLDADPTVDIAATRAISGVWIAGERGRMILVTAAHGNQGKLLVPKLVASGHEVRAAVRPDASAEHLRAAGCADVVVGDLSEPQVLATAIRGVRKVYHVGPTLHPREREMGLAVVDAAPLGAVISTVLDRPVAVAEIDADTYARAWLGDRDPADATHQLAVLRSISARYSAHDFVGNPNVLTWLLQREPTSFAQFVRREWHAHQEGR